LTQKGYNPSSLARYHALSTHTTFLLTTLSETLSSRLDYKVEAKEENATNESPQNRASNMIGKLQQVCKQLSQPQM
jgi:hypothetical protein